MESLDTSIAAARAQADAYRRMGPQRRVQTAAAMSDDARAISAQGIRDRHPAYSESEVRYALNRLILGDDLFAAAWPNVPLLQP